MIAFVKGRVSSIGEDHVIVENNGIGYYIHFSKTNDLQMNDDIKIYIYHHIREDANDLFGFSSMLERNTFLKLISVRGVGPKTAINIMANVEVGELVSAIEGEDINYLKKLPGIGPKSAKQIVLDLKGKLASDALPQVQNNELNDALEGLKQLGYNNNDLKSIEAKLKENKDLSAEDYMKKALKLLAKRRGA